MFKQFVSRIAALAAMVLLCCSALFINSKAWADDETGFCTTDGCPDSWYGPVIWVETLPNGCIVDVQYFTRTASCDVPPEQEVYIEKIWQDANNTCTVLMPIPDPPYPDLPPPISVQALFEEAMLQLLSDASDPSLNVPGMGPMTSAMPTSSSSPCLTVYSIHEGYCWEWDGADPGVPGNESYHSCTTDYDCCNDTYQVCYNSAAGGSNLVWTKTSTVPGLDCTTPCQNICGVYHNLDNSVLTANSNDYEYGS